MYPNIPDDTCAVVQPLRYFEKQTGLCLTSSLVKLDDTKRTPIGFFRVTSTIITVPKDTKIAKFFILTPKQASYIQPLNAELFTEHLNHSIHKLISADPNIGNKPRSNNALGFLTPQISGNSHKPTGISERFYDELLELKEQEQLDPTA